MLSLNILHIYRIFSIGFYIFYCKKKNRCSDVCTHKVMSERTKKSIWKKLCKNE